MKLAIQLQPSGIAPLRLISFQTCWAVWPLLLNWLSGRSIDFLAEAIQRDPVVSLMKTNRPTVDTIQSYRKAPATTVNKWVRVLSQLYPTKLLSSIDKRDDSCYTNVEHSM